MTRDATPLPSGSKEPLLSLSSSDIRLIIDALQESGWDQASVVIGDVRIAVARNGLSLDGAAPAPAPSAPAVAQAPAAPPVGAPATPPAAPPAASAPEPAPASAGGHVVAAPSVGVFWRAPQPGAAPFVEVGSRVAAGDTLGIVEVMKLMNTISADVSGVVTAVHVANAGAVEFGTPLFSIEVED